MEIINNTNITQIFGNDKVTHVKFDKPYKGSIEFKTDGVFVEIGHIPQSQLAISFRVKIDKKGDIIINRGAETNVPEYLLLEML